MRESFYSRASIVLYFMYNHSATITLHNPYIDFSNPENVSAARCVNSARCILSAYYVLTATSLDITRLHPFVTVIKKSLCDCGILRIDLLDLLVSCSRCPSTAL